MRINTRADFSRTRAKLQRAKGAVKMTLGGELTRAARLVAVQLAHSTVPFGLDERAHQLGMNATARDIRLCYATLGDVYAAFPDESKAKAFYALVKRGLIARAQAVVDDYCPKFKGTPIGHFDLFLHQGRRNKRGRISKNQKPLQIVVDSRPLKKYIKAEVALVGWGKAGWASAARTLGGIRGISARWVTRHKAPGASFNNFERATSSETPFITIVNGVSYAHLILTPAAKAEAVRVGLERYLSDRRLTRVVRAALRQALT